FFFGGSLVLGGCCVGVADAGDDGSDVDGVVFLSEDLNDGAGDGGGDLCVDLVGGDLEQWLVNLDGIADSLQPLGDGALGDGFAEFRHFHIGGGSGGCRCLLLRLLLLGGGLFLGGCLFSWGFLLGGSLVLGGCC